MIAATLGWIGTAGTLVAYLSLSRGWLSNASRRYTALNIVGGTLAGIACVLYGAWPSVVSNFAWAAIGVLSVAGQYRPGSRRVPRPAEVCATSG